MIGRRILLKGAAASMTGLGTPTPSRFPYPGRPQPSPGVAPGSGQIIRARQVIVSGANGGMFVYNGTPRRGNPPVFYVIAPGSANVDPFGNTLGGPILGVQGSPSSGALTIDANGNLNLISPSGVTVMQFSPDLTAALIYNSSGAGPGNLIASISPGSGTDGHGNPYLGGVSSYSPGSAYTELISGGVDIGSNNASTEIITPAQVSITDALTASARPFLVVAAPFTAAPNAAQLALAGESADATGPAIAELTATQFVLRSFSGGPMYAVPVNASTGQPETWNLMALLNSWVNQAGQVTCKYRLVAAPANSVEIIGSLTATAATSTTFFQLPAGYRPASAQQFACVASGGVPAGAAPGINCDASGNLSVNHSTIGAANNYEFHGLISLDA